MGFGAVLAGGAIAGGLSQTAQQLEEERRRRQAMALQERGLGLQEEFGRERLGIAREGLGLQREQQKFSQGRATERDKITDKNLGISRGINLLKLLVDNNQNEEALKVSSQLIERWPEELSLLKGVTSFTKVKENTYKLEKIGNNWIFFDLKKFIDSGGKEGVTYIHKEKEGADSTIGANEHFYQTIKKEMKLTPKEAFDLMNQVKGKSKEEQTAGFALKLIDKGAAPTPEEAVKMAIKLVGLLYPEDKKTDEGREETIRQPITGQPKKRFIYEGGELRPGN